MRRDIQTNSQKATRSTMTQRAGSFGPIVYGPSNCVYKTQTTKKLKKHTRRATRPTMTRLAKAWDQKYLDHQLRARQKTSEMTRKSIILFVFLKLDLKNVFVVVLNWIGSWLLNGCAILCGCLNYSLCWLDDYLLIRLLNEYHSSNLP